MPRLHLHLLSDSTGETLETIAKAALAQFEGADVSRHFWPMVRSLQHLDRIMGEIASHPGLVFYTLANLEIRDRLEERCRALGLPTVAVLDSAVQALKAALGQHPHARPHPLLLLAAAAQSPAPQCGRGQCLACCWWCC